MNLNKILYLHKNNAKWITDVNVKCKTMKHLGDNTGENLDDFGYGDTFSDKK